MKSSSPGVRKGGVLYGHACVNAFRAYAMVDLEHCYVTLYCHKGKPIDFLSTVKFLGIQKQNVLLSDCIATVGRQMVCAGRD